MADEADRTQERDEQEAPARLAAARKAEAPKTYGKCLYCNADIAATLRFCDAYCRDDYEHEQTLRKLAGN